MRRNSWLCGPEYGFWHKWRSRVLDLKLPIKNGFEILQWLRQRPDLASLHVVVVSSSASDADIARARDLGILDYIIKPSAPSALLEIIQKGRETWLG